jgi:guanylate kinase
MDLANLQRSKISEFDYVVKNVDINTTVKEILDIICNLEES